MPTCPECGLDVESEGLCDECRSDNKNKSNKPNSTISIINIIILILTGFLSGFTGILIGRILPGINTVNVIAKTSVEPQQAADYNKTEDDVLDDELIYD